MQKRFVRVMALSCLVVTGPAVDYTAAETPAGSGSLPSTATETWYRETGRLKLGRMIRRYICRQALSPFSAFSMTFLISVARATGSPLGSMHTDTCPVSVGMTT